RNRRSCCVVVQAFPSALSRSAPFRRIFDLERLTCFRAVGSAGALRCARESRTERRIKGHPLMESNRARIVLEILVLCSLGALPCRAQARAQPHRTVPANPMPAGADEAAKQEPVAGPSIGVGHPVDFATVFRASGDRSARAPVETPSATALNSRPRIPRPTA